MVKARSRASLDHPLVEIAALHVNCQKYSELIAALGALLLFSYEKAGGLLMRSPI